MSNKTYLCIMRSQGRQKNTTDSPSPEQMEAMFANYNEWKDKYKSNIVDKGGKLGDGKVVTAQGVSDGPFVESKEIAGGFMIVSAENLEFAAKVAHESPGVFPGSSVEVREIIRP